MSCCVCSGSILKPNWATALKLRSGDTEEEAIELTKQKGSCDEYAATRIVETRCEGGCRHFFHSACFETKIVRQKQLTKYEPEASESDACAPASAVWGNRQFLLSLRCFPLASCHANVCSVCLLSLTPTRGDGASSNMVKVSAALACLPPPACA